MRSLYLTAVAMNRTTIALSLAIFGDDGSIDLVVVFLNDSFPFVSCCIYVRSVTCISWNIKR